MSETPVWHNHDHCVFFSFSFHVGMLSEAKFEGWRDLKVISEPGKSNCIF